VLKNNEVTTWGQLVIKKGQERKNGKPGPSGDGDKHLAEGSVKR